MFLTEAANRGSISTGYDIDNSCKFEADNDEHLYVTTMTSGNRKTWTYSIWFKRTELAFTNVLIHFGVNTHATRMMIDDSDQLWIDVCDTGSTNYRSKTNRLFRDTSAWYHVVLRVDTTQSTEADRMKVYVNGVEETSWAQHQIPPQNLDTLANTTAAAYDAMGIGTYVWAGGSYDGNFSGYIAQVAHVDGQSYAATEFGEFDEDSGIWKPKDITELTYGSSNNSFLLDFSDSSDLGNDSSGNNNDWSLNNIAAADQATDTPTNNFAIGNVLTSVGGFLVPTEGATRGTLSTSGPGNNTGGASLYSTIPVSKGKWYFEAQNTNSGDVYLYLGVGDVGGVENWGIDGEAFGQAGGPSVAWRGGGAHGSNSKVYINNVASGNSVTWETEVVGIALDLDNDKIYFHKEGTYINSGDPANGTDNGGQYDLPTAVDDQWCIGVAAYNLATWELNFGGYTAMSISSAQTDANGYGTFEYAPPSGYYALCTKNLAEYG